MNPYPGSTPEFRVLKKDGAMILQIRYINSAMGYVGKWEDVPVVEYANN